ncbi:YceI family protein [Granulicella sibirica]|uniref:Protein yceI n=1 Tax=Granulicella sibirica TaxID=2479048 RepID=A0A4Q0T229_9BACT|nr:YceI family protein [Granulicella sibirica]RXH56450.1 Protein yceI precursor [Granulicella sibirica]
MNRRLFTATFAALLLSGTSAFAQSSTWTIDKNHSQINFQIRHMGVSNVRGSISGVTGEIVWDEKDPSKDSVTATATTSTVTTNNEKRDAHLKSPDFFNVEKSPTLTFKSTKVFSEGGKLKVIGDLTLGGVTKSTTLEVDGPSAPQPGQNGKVVTGLSVTGQIKRSDFGFGQKFTAPVLGDDVQFTIDVEAGK